jgi:hypothetical protein
MEQKLLLLIGESVVILLRVVGKGNYVRWTEEAVHNPDEAVTPKNARRSLTGIALYDYHRLRRFLARMPDWAHFRNVALRTQRSH